MVVLPLTTALVETVALVVVVVVTTLEMEMLLVVLLFRVKAMLVALVNQAIAHKQQAAAAVREHLVLEIRLAMVALVLLLIHLGVP